MQIFDPVYQKSRAGNKLFLMIKKRLFIYARKTRETYICFVKNFKKFKIFNKTDEFPGFFEQNIKNLPSFLLIFINSYS